jgi:LPS sulfotransferase NodH
MRALLITRQRTGSGALGTILHRNPDLFYAGEVLHPTDGKNELNFYTYLNAHPDQALHFANPNTRVGAIKQYLTHLQEKTSPRGLVLDIKYNALHQWNQGWQGILGRPWVLGHARQHNIPILHLRRRNYVATFVSGRLAEQNKVWHTSKAEALNIHSINVPTKDLRGFLNICVREATLITEWLANYSNVLTLEYEDMLDETGNMPESTATELATFLGVVPFTARNSVFIKQAPAKLSDSIENFEEVALSLRDTEFSWMMRTG